MAINFSMIVNAQEVAATLNQQTEALIPRLRQEIERLSVSAHAFVINHAQAKLHGETLNTFLGKDNRNIRWMKVDDNIWVVEIDESVRHIEEGASRVFMEWLLTKNPKAKRAKDGSMYARIPISNARFGGPGQNAVNDRRPDLAAMVRNEMKSNKISLKRIEKNSDGTPKLGILHKISPQMPGPQSQFPTLYSMPRNHEMAALTGLKPHGGIPLTKGTLIVQRIGKHGKEKGKLIREAVTFRTISSKHKAEGRWFTPAKDGLKSLQAAYEYSLKEWDKTVKALQDEFNPR